MDGGKTWAATNVSRQIQPAFAGSLNRDCLRTGGGDFRMLSLRNFYPMERLWCSRPISGGMGTDAANSIALDPAGNRLDRRDHFLFMTFQSRQGVHQGTLKGSTSGYVAKFASDGTLLLSRLSRRCHQEMAVWARDRPAGQSMELAPGTSSDFPFTAGPVPTVQSSSGLLAELDSSASQLLFATRVDGFFDAGGKGIAVDAIGNVTITGTTYDSKFPFSVSPLGNGAPSFNSKAFVMKVDSSGNQIYSTMFGGSKDPPPAGVFQEAEHDAGVAVAVDNSEITILRALPALPIFQ